MRPSGPLALAWLLALSAAACSPVGQPGVGGPQQLDDTRVRQLKGARGVVRFKACDRQPADPSSTNLRSTTLPAGAVSGERYDIDVPDGRVVIEHATDLQLTDGKLISGSGAEVAMGGGELEPVEVAPEAVTAPVTLAVLESPQAGRRVAFVEIRLHPDPPIRWDEERRLHIGTDGGDGGFATTSAKSISWNDPALEESSEAFFPDGNSAAGNVCVLRSLDDQLPDSVLFLTGYGDGGYPTVLGRAADGRVVSLVSYGFVVPWRLGGLPGTPPREVIEQERKPR